MNGIPVPRGHWLDPNADEAWAEYNRRLIDGYFPGTLPLRQGGTPTTGTSTGSPAPTTSSTSRPYLLPQVVADQKANPDRYTRRAPQKPKRLTKTQTETLTDDDL